MARVSKPSRTLRSELKRLDQQQRRNNSASPFDASGLTVIDAGQVVQDGAVTIPDNGLLLVDGGDVSMLDQEPSATELFRLGTQQYGDRGVTIRRNDGSAAFEVRNQFSAGDPRQSSRILDPSGAQIAGDSILSPSGFDAPHMEMRFIPTDYTSGATAQNTTSGTFVATHEYRGFRQNPALKMQVMVMCSDGTTSAEVQVWNVINAVYLGGFLGSPAVHTITVPTGTTAFTLFEFSTALAIPGSMSANLHLQIHARRTAGAGTVSVAPVRTIGSGF